jgi:hypothetical protein
MNWGAKTKSIVPENKGDPSPLGIVIVITIA